MIPEVVVIDYGVGNLHSVQRALEHCGAKVLLTSDPERILAANRVILPGVGAFENAMQVLKNLDLVTAIRELPKREIPLLGICLGMQLLLDESEEFGVTSGLGLIPGRVVPVPSYTKLGVPQKIPHIGWSALMPSEEVSGWQNTLLQDVKSSEAVYFIHSYMASPNTHVHRIAECMYGEHKIAAVIGFEKVMGCQFHPEKSGEVGLKILKRFLQL